MERALFGSIRPHQKMMLKTQLSHIDFLDQQIVILNEEVQQRMQPYEEDIELLDSIPDIGRSHAEQLMAEIGLGKDISINFLRLLIFVRGLGWSLEIMKVLGKKSPEKREKVIKN